MGRFFKSWFARFDAVALRPPDPYLCVPAAVLLIGGAMMSLNTTYFPSLAKTGDAFHFFKLHLIRIAAGAIVLGTLSQFSRRGLERLARPLMLGSCAMLLAVWIPKLGVEAGGARRWLRLGPAIIEPSELVKFALVFFLADFLSRRAERMSRFAAGPMPVLVIAGAIAAALLTQPDFGTAVILAALAFVMLYVAGARPAHLGLPAAAALAILGVEAVHKAYRMKRLTAFLDPWGCARGAGFQLVQSFIALGAGGGWGVGLGAGRQKMFYLPQAHTDFVFAVIGEEFGLAGALAVIGLFAAIAIRGLQIASREPDPFASLLGVGLSALLSLQALINIAVVVGLIPTKGLPLPFLSYGGTATMISMATLGALLALARRPAVK